MTTGYINLWYFCNGDPSPLSLLRQLKIKADSVIGISMALVSFLFLMYYTVSRVHQRIRCCVHLIRNPLSGDWVNSFFLFTSQLYHASQEQETQTLSHIPLKVCKSWHLHYCRYCCFLLQILLSLINIQKMLALFKSVV